MTHPSTPTARRVKADKHDYKPSPGLGLGCVDANARLHAFTVSFQMTASAWFDPTVNGPLGADGKDWNKLGGYSYAQLLSPSTWPKNRNSAIMAWRPINIQNMFEYCLYLNDGEGGFSTSEPALVGIHEIITANVVVFEDREKLTNNIALYVKSFINGSYVNLGDMSHQSMSLNILKPLKYRIGTWFGGNRTAPVSNQIHVDLDE
jgi:hypothetical protein